MNRRSVATPVPLAAIILIISVLLFGSAACDSVIGVVAPSPTTAAPPTATSTDTPLPTSTPTSTATATPTNTPTPTATPTPPIEQVGARASKSVVSIVLDQGACTGAVVNGGILTAASCLESARQARVVTSEQLSTRGKVVRMDLARDLALLEPDTDFDLPPLEIGRAKDEPVGQPVVALAYPASGSRTVGYVGSSTVVVTRGSLVAVSDDQATGATRVKTDAALADSGLGGPILDAHGTLIGVVSFASNETVVTSSGVAGETVSSFLTGPAQPIPTLRPTWTPTRTPAPTSTPLPRRLTTGTFVKNMTRNGLGQLKIVNKDAVLDLVAGLRSLDKKRSVLVYVRAKGSYTIKGIPDGTYQSIYVQGQDYDKASGTFTRQTDGWWRFESNVAFKTTRTSTARIYTIWTFTFSDPGHEGDTVVPLD